MSSSFVGLMNTPTSPCPMSQNKNG